MRVAIGADNLGFQLKERLREHLARRGHEAVDFGCHSEEPIDYPDVAVLVANEVASGAFDRAILVCGTGIGMAITANKVPGVRAANVSDAYCAERARKSNNAQVLCLGARVVSPENAAILVDHWLESEFQGGESERKVEKIRALERRAALV